MIGRTNSILGNTILYSDYFGDGSDGDLVVEAGMTHLLDVGSDEQQVLRQYDNLTIETGATLRPSGRCNGTIILVKHDLILDGTISVDRCAPLVNSAEGICAQESHILLCRGLKGGRGGNGGTYAVWHDAKYFAATAAGVGSEGFVLGGGFGGGSAGVGASAWSGGDGTRAPVGTTIPYPAGAGVSIYGVGGSVSGGNGGAGYGGSGAVAPLSATNSTHTSQTPVRGNDGNAIGGGALFIFVGGTVTIGETGVVSANGGDGGHGVGGTFVAHLDFPTNYAVSGGGGAGGGGIIALIHNGRYSSAGTIIARGGHGGNSASLGGVSSGAGQDGGVGEILITKLKNLL